VADADVGEVIPPLDVEATGEVIPPLDVEAMGEVIPPLDGVGLAGVVGAEGAPDVAESVRERVDSFLSRPSLPLLKSAAKGFDISW